MKIITNSLQFIIVIMLSSCTLSKTFHHPGKMNYDLEKISYITQENDTTFIKYNSETKLIRFFDTKKNQINKNYTVKNIFIQSKSDNLLNAWLLTPNTNIKGTIIHFHGSAGNLFAHYKIIAPLLDKGFQVLSFDYSGYGYSKGKAKRNNIELDAISIFNYAMNKGIIKGKTVLYGQSYGGYLASMVTLQNQKKIDALVLEGSFTSHKDIAKYRVPLLGNIVKNGLKTKDMIKNIHVPLLIIHSVEDKVVPYKMGKILYSNANNPKSFLKIKHKHLEGLKYYSNEIATKIFKLMNSKSIDN